MSKPYLVATSAILARKSLTTLRGHLREHEPDGTFQALKSLVTQLETIRYHDEDAFYASMDHVMASLRMGERT
jgi:hypothetical protein